MIVIADCFQNNGNNASRLFVNFELQKLRAYRAIGSGPASQAMAGPLF